MSSMAASRGVEVMVTNRSPKPEERVRFLPAPLGAVSERQGVGLQNRLHRFDSDQRLHAPVAQRIEQPASTRLAGGSSPSGCTPRW